jgi:WhiB family redox-sensing transcriptional regulator
MARPRYFPHEGIQTHKRRAESISDPQPNSIDLIATYVAQRPAWMSDPRRHCAGVPGHLFFGTNKAIPICDGCPFIRPCLEYALEHDEYGVWGGTSEKDRRKIKAKQHEQKKNSSEQY